MEKDAFQNAKSIEELHVEYQNQMRNIEIERDEISKRIRLVEVEEENFEEFQRNTYLFIRRVEESDRGPQELQMIREYEFAMKEYNMQTKNSIEDKKEELEHIKKYTYNKEEEIKQQFQHYKELF